MLPRPLFASLLALSLILGACAKNERVLLDLVTVPVGTGCGDPVLNPQALPRGLHSLRLTFMRRPRDESTSAATLRRYQLVCDRVFPPSAPGEGKQEVELAIPRGGEGDDRLAVRVEAFNPQTGVLELAGQVEAADLVRTARLFLRPTGSSGQGDESTRGLSCVEPARKYRAFHSATLLPNGQVLLLGGLSAEPGEANSPLLHITDTEVVHATDSVEVYDPGAMRFRVVPLQTPMPSRAFHQAILLPSPPAGPFRVLLLGGVTSTLPAPAFFFRHSRGGLPFLISPHDQASAAENGVITYSPGLNPDENGQVTYTPLEGAPEALFPAVALIPGEDLAIAISGGADHVPVYANPDPKSESGKNDDRGFPSNPPALILDLASTPPGVTAVPAQGRIRAGHALTPLGDHRLLMVGGTMSGFFDNPGDVATLEQHRSGAPPTLESTSLSYPITATAWHTLTPMASDAELLGETPSGPGAALWAGGFRLVDDSAKNMRIAEEPLARDDQSAADPNNQDLPLLLLNNEEFPPLGPLPLPGRRLLPVGYLEAVRLPDGSVLLSGGNANKNVNSLPEGYAAPVACNGNAFCPVAQMAIVSPVGATSPPLEPPPMAHRRMGHRTTRLLDNTILITGGIGAVDGVPQLVREAESYSPRRGAPEEDYPFHREPAMDCESSPRCRDALPPPPEGWRCQLRNEID